MNGLPNKVGGKNSHFRVGITKVAYDPRLMRVNQRSFGERLLIANMRRDS